MDRKKGIFLGVAGLILLIVIAVIVIVANKDEGVNYGDFKRSVIISLAKANNYSDYGDIETIIPANENTGNLSEKIAGNENAKVVIYEYADYSCSHCADANTTVTKLLEKYSDDEVALVFRELVLQFPNSVSSASAATAANIQGYWEKYKNLLFSNQAEWYSLRGNSRDTYFGNLFMEASDGKGDLEKFYEDYRSEAVAKRVAFNYGIAADVLEITGTPTFRINGEKVALSELEATINKLLGR